MPDSWKNAGLTGWPGYRLIMMNCVHVTRTVAILINIIMMPCIMSIAKPRIRLLITFRNAMQYRVDSTTTRVCSKFSQNLQNAYLSDCYKSRFY